MGFFTKKTENSSKEWSSVIRNIGITDDLVWCHPEEFFKTNSTLIVQPGEEALFVKNGHIEQVFTNGSYTLTTENYPFLSRLIAKFTGGESAFNCRVYFMRVASSMEVTWGTDGPIQVRDKLLQIQTDLLARGSYKLQIGDSGKFLTKLLGNRIGSFSPQDIKKYFGTELLGEIKACISTVIAESNQEILGISSRIVEISKMMEPHMRDVFAEYGVELLKFAISGIDIADAELRRRYDEINMDAIAKMRNAQADRNVMECLGDKWMAQQQVDIMKNFSMQDSGVSGAGAGIGMGMAAGAAFFGMGNQMMQQQAVAAPTPPPVSQWYVYLNGQQIGPINTQQVQGYISSGQMKPRDLVWKNGFQDWMAAESVPEIASLFGPPSPPTPPVPPAPNRM